MASSVASQVILFIAVIIITTGLVAVFNNYVQQTTSSAKIQWQLMSNNLKADVTIETVYFNSSASPQQTTVYIENTGKVDLDVNQTDVYIDKFFIPRDQSVRNMTIEPSTDTVDIGIWNEHEIVKAIIYKDLDSSSTHEVCISTQYKTQECKTFSAS